MINRARRYWHTALCQRAIMSAMPWQWHPAFDAIDPEEKLIPAYLSLGGA